MHQSPRAEPVDLDRRVLDEWPLPVDPNGDKHQRGTALVIGGSATTPGAVVLAGRAALRMGAGRLQIITHPTVAGQLAVTVPEAKVVGCAACEAEAASMIDAADAILVGPGLDPGDDNERWLRLVFEHAPANAVVVADAAALVALRKLEPATIDRVAGRLVLTPNRQELQALTGADADDIEQVSDVAERFGAVVTTFAGVCAPDGRRWRGPAGHPALGTSGSGDVQGGFIAGVAARTGDAAQSACWGTYAHARAGEALGERYGQLGFLAHELIDTVAQVVPDGGG